jgi:hypothetical protein
MIFSIKFIQVCGKLKKAGATIRNFGSRSRRHLISTSRKSELGSGSTTLGLGEHYR